MDRRGTVLPPSNGQPDPPALSVSPLAPKAAGLQALTVAAAVLIGAYLIFALHQLLGAYALFEAAQLQRVLNQRYTKEMLLASAGVPVNYEKTANEWSKSLTVLTHGGELPSEDPSAAGMRVQTPVFAAGFQTSLQNMAALQQKIVQRSAEFMEANRLNQHRQQLFDELFRQSLELQAAGDALVQTYDRHLNSGVSWWDVNAIAVELAERQRMLIQQHVKEILFVAHGIPADYQATRLRLFETVKILSEGGPIHIDGGEAITVPAPGSADIQFNLEQQKTALERFTAVSNQFLMLANEDVERNIQLKGLSDLTAEYHTLATDLLSQYRRSFGRKVDRATRDAAAAGVLAALFAVFLAWTFGRKYVDLPALRLTEALRALRSGKRPEPQADAESDGPLAGVAQEIDRCAAAWGSRRSWFESFLSASDPSSVQDPGDKDPVAASVYQWYKTRLDDPGTRTRWTSDDVADNGITVVGRLPDAEPVPSVQDSELLDQLIRRANELQAQCERMTGDHARLEEETRALRSAHAQGDEVNAALRTENAEFLQKNTELLQENAGLLEANAHLRAQIAEQMLALGRLAQRAEMISSAESTLNASADELQRLNTEMSRRLEEQSGELGRLRAELARAEADLRERSAQAEGVSAERLAERQAAGRDIEALRARLSETETSAAALRFESQKQGELARIEAARREEAESQLNKLKGALEASLVAHRDALERQAALLDAVRRDKEILERDKAASDRGREALAGEKVIWERARQAWADEKASLEIERARLENERAALDRTVADLGARLESAIRDRAEEAQNHETAAARMQDALAQQTLDIERLRTELEEARSRYLADAGIKTREIESIRQDLEGRETELWQTRKELADLQRQMAATRMELSSLTKTGATQVAQIETLRSHLTDLEIDLRAKAAALQTAAAERDRLEDEVRRSRLEQAEQRERLESELTALRSAFLEKCQSLTSAEDRLTATRAALKTTLEELQERSKP